MKVQFTDLQPEDEVQWRSLYADYIVPYPWNDQKASILWSWLMDPNHVMEGFAARLGTEEIAGFVHFQKLPRCAYACNFGYIEDLYVDQQYRKKGIGAGLVSAVADRARKNGWKYLRWHTNTDNTVAQKLYDRIAKKMDRVMYELTLEPVGKVQT
jgi:GNAT superfamily N-acetyltransferase